MEGFEFLREDEREIFFNILNSVKDYKSTYTKPRQVRKVVPVEQWLEDPYYVGPSGMSLYPYWKKEIAKIFDSNNPDYINELLVDGSIGTGKTTAANFCLMRKLYEISCYENIPGLFDLMPGSIISFIYFSISKTQAELTGYGQLKNLIDQSPYFKENFPRNDRIQSMLVFPENVLVIFGSEQTHSTGMNMMGSVLDEANFRQANAQSENVSLDHSKVSTMYASIINRASSRFVNKGKNYSLSILVSSNTTSSSFTEQRKKQIKRDKHARIINARLWDVKPQGTYDSKGFWVFVGSDILDPMIIDTVEEMWQVTDSWNVSRTGSSIEEVLDILSENYREYFTWVPNDFRKQYEDNIIMSLQDISGYSVAPSGRLFSSKPAYASACDNDLEHPFTKNIIVLSTKDDIYIKDWLRKDWYPRHRNSPRYIHFDQSLAHDRTGAASVYLDHWKIDESSGVYKPYYTCEMLMSVAPPKPPGKISIEKCMNIVYYMRDVWNLPIGQVTYDSYACLTGDTIIETSNGSKRLRDVEIGDNVLNNTGYCRVLDKFEYREAPILEVETNRGKAIKGTPNHRIRVLDKWTESKGYSDKFDRDLYWTNKNLSNKRRPIWKYKRLDELKEGDILDVEYFEYDSKVKYDFSKVFKNKDKVDSGIISYLYGYGLGDGTFSVDGIKYTFGNKEEAEYVMSLVSEVTGNSKIIKKNETYYNGMLGSRRLIRILSDKFGYVHQRDYKKRVAPGFKNLSNQDLIELVNGLIDSDGSISKNGDICITSVSKGLLDDIKYICEYRLGIRAVIILAGKSCEKVYPNGKIYTARDYYQLHMTYGTDILLNGKYRRKLNDKNCVKLGRYVFHKVKSIKIADYDTVYDIHVDREQAYFANGIYSHNSAGAQQTFESNGINCTTLSVDRTEEQYMYLVNCILQGQIQMYNHPVLEKELFDLIYYRDRHKVDHPKAYYGSGESLNTTWGGSKDLTDGLAGALWGCYKSLQEEQANQYASEENKRVNKINNNNNEDLLSEMGYGDDIFSKVIDLESGDFIV